MRKRIIVFIAIMLFVSNTITVIGFTDKLNGISINYQDPNQNYRTKVKHLDDGRLPPDPGEVSPDFIFKKSNVVKINENPPTKNLLADENAIINILEIIDENLIVEYLEDLVSFGPRVTGSSACEAAGDYIYNEFVSYGLEARYDPWSYGSYSGNNIEGTLPGFDEESDEIYIICAHYDSVSGSPGADDDGSGTAAVLAAAYTMSQYDFNHTIRFVAFDGEEQGLLGSYRYVEECNGNGDNIIAALNGDMIGYAENPTQASYIKTYENPASQWITDFTEEVSQTYSDYFELTIVPSGPAYNSDHASFWDFYYDSIMYHEYEFNQYYHSPQDTIENMDTDYATRVSRLEIATLGELAEARPLSEPPETPSKPEGVETWIINIETSFSTSTTDPEGDHVYYMFDWGDGNFSEWVGPYASGETGKASYAWDELGDYEIKVIAKDIYEIESNWSEPAFISIVENEPPEKVTIDGPSMGVAGKKYEYTFVSTDPDGHDIYYRVEWDDGQNTGWLGPYSSGEQITLNHSWNKKGEYWIKAWAKDTLDGKSQQASFRFTVLKNAKSQQTNQRYIDTFIIRILEMITNRFPKIQNLINI